MGVITFMVPYAKTLLQNQIWRVSLKVRCPYRSLDERDHVTFGIIQRITVEDGHTVVALMIS